MRWRGGGDPVRYVETGPPSGSSRLPAKAGGDMAEAMAEVVSQLATKPDLAALQAATKADIAVLRAELRADIAALRTELEILKT